MKISRIPLFCLFAASFSAAAPVATTAELLKAVAEAKPGSVVEIGGGRFELSAPLQIGAGLTLKVHHNTIETNLSIEFAHENDEDVEIDRNILLGCVSITKHSGGALPENGKTFHIHHNYFTTSYVIEFPRNGAEIDHNLFDLRELEDGGNLISGFGGVASPGPAGFHNNLVSNPGRGVVWIERAHMIAG